MIEIKGLTKRYGALTALEDLTLSIGPGEIFGFIGPNGAGKTTTMKILSCLLRADAGSASIDGLDVTRDGDKIRRLIGYMPDFIGVYDDLTVGEYLQFFASAFGVPRSRRRAVIDGVLELTDLTGKRDAMVESLSRGMTQRLGVARVLIHDPKVLLLDEPASGLDPRARIEMRSLLTELGRMGKSLMVSSHILSELGEMSTSIGIIEKGKLIYAGTLKDALEKTRGGERIAVTLEPGGASAGAVRGVLERDERVAGVKVVSSREGEAGEAAGVNGGAAERLLVELRPGAHGHHFVIEGVLAAGGRIGSFEPQGVKLEDAFLRLTKGVLQ
ncbi:MAG: ABC transporter ATP-binding protein [Phycisphaeraceae bacterium]|nr:MAG: ABC transporter ATP-binding protein [Phycisphaeraceae bacterium]